MRKRIRSLGDDSGHTDVKIGVKGNPGISSVYVGNSYTKTSTMTDFVGKSLTRRRFIDPSKIDIGIKAGNTKFFHASHCDHLVVDATAFTPLRYWRYAPNDTERFRSLLTDLKFYVTPSTFSTCLAAINADAVEEAAREAFTSFETQFPMEVSLPNFLLELNPFESLGKMKFYRKKAQEELAALRGENLSAALAGNFLGLEFGVKPFLDDLEKLRNIVSTVDKGLDTLRRSKGRSSKLNFKRSLTPALIPGFPTQFLQGGWNYNQIPTLRCTLEHLSSEFRAGAWLYHDLDLDSASAKVRAYAAALGLLNPIAVIWEAIPFSFVVDWITDVSSILTELKAQPFLGTWHVRDMCYSVKDIATFKTEQSYFDPAVGGDPNWRPTGSVSVRRYQRRIGLPMKLAGLSLPLTGKQSLLSAALSTGMVPDLDRIGRRF